MLIVVTPQNQVCSAIFAMYLALQAVDLRKLGTANAAPCSSDVLARAMLCLQQLLTEASWSSNVVMF